MSAIPALPTLGRDFLVWEYQVSHSQLLLRSPKAPATDACPAFSTNLDIVFLGVDYMAVPRSLKRLALDRVTAIELEAIEATLGASTAPHRVTILVSGSGRFPVVAASVAVSENDWDIFDSPFEFRSRFRDAPGRV